MANLDEDDPEAVWPLKASSPSDLDWLRMSQGKKAVWQIANFVGRPDSPLYGTVLEFSRPPQNDEEKFLIALLWATKMGSASPEQTDLAAKHASAAFSGLPPELASYCELDDQANHLNNPYFIPGVLVGSLMRAGMKRQVEPMNQPVGMLSFVTFISQMTPEFKRLLGTKDPRALLLFAYFSALIAQSKRWWAMRRFKVEGEAICRYLERNHGHVPGMDSMLIFPRRYAAGGVFWSGLPFVNDIRTEVPITVDILTGPGTSLPT
jgi:hypothetical protein